MNYLTS